jgi:hypothetical protein
MQGIQQFGLNRKPEKARFATFPAQLGKNVQIPATTGN